MSTKHLLHALRVVAPLALLFLAACSDKAQVANTAQQVMDAKNPGVVGAIENALGTSTGNPETDAAIGAEDVVKKMEQTDKLEAEARDAANKGDYQTAEAKLDDARKIRPGADFDFTEYGIALQCGEIPRNDSQVNVIHRLSEDEYATRDGHTISPKEINFVTAGIREIERTRQAVSNMKDKLTLAEYKRRQADLAGRSLTFYLYREEFYRANGDLAKADADHASMDAYSKMEWDLKYGDVPNNIYNAPN